MMWFWVIVIVWASVMLAAIVAEFMPTLDLWLVGLTSLMFRKPLPSRKPDYEKIARLEVELGLVDPPAPQLVVKPPSQRFDPDGFGWKTRGVRDK